ncbi:glycosyltransferase family 8 protein [Hamadaea sp. NPDC051192]|uniref:glycosyltransferase family 8 protein n=1 Tax=Hamadaea sp. NPDC051192 TaxID=3154940 RepID=UPI00341D601D
MPDEAERPVVVTFDSRYTRAAMAMLHSLSAVRTGQKTTVIALAGELPQRQAYAVTSAAHAAGLDFEIRDMTGACLDLPFDSHGSPAVYYRLHIAELLPEYDSALYVDADTIFLRDPAELLTLDLGPHPLAAVQDVCVPTLGSPDCLPGVPLDEDERALPYFNSGLLVIDLDHWRRLGIGSAALRFATTSAQHVRFWDQDALNHVVRGDWRRLDRRWNVFPLEDIWQAEEFPYYGEEYVPRTGLARLAREAYLIHFVTRHKPWTDSFPAGRLRDLWWSYDEPAVR